MRMAKSKSAVQLLLSVESLTTELLFFKVLQAGVTITSRRRLGGRLPAVITIADSKYIYTPSPSIRLYINYLISKVTTKNIEKAAKLLADSINSLPLISIRSLDHRIDILNQI